MENPNDPITQQKENYGKQLSSRVANQNYQAIFDTSLEPREQNYNQYYQAHHRQTGARTSYDEYGHTADYHPIKDFMNKPSSQNYRTNTVSYYPGYNSTYHSSYHNSRIAKNATKPPYNSSHIAYAKPKKMAHTAKKQPKGISKKMLFIQPYEKTNDYSYYKQFFALNLKFLKQNYKFKENFENEENSNILPRFNMNVNNNQLMYMAQMNNLNNMTKIQSMNFNLGQTSITGMQGMPGGTGSNYQNNSTLNFQNFQKMTNFQQSLNQNQGVQNNSNNIKSNVYSASSTNIPNIHLDLNLTLEEQTQCVSNNLVFVNPYLSSNKSFSTENLPITNPNLNQNIGNPYYESLRLQPYTFIRDPKIIDENIRSGRYLKGVIRINKCHTHGYITVAGLVNDILIRGNRNLNQSMHLDEVIVELFPMVCWKPLFNKKIRKLSLVQEEKEHEKDVYSSSKKSPKRLNEFLSDEEGFEDKIEGANEEGGMKYRESFENVEDRLSYINTVFNLRPEGRIVKILKSPNIDKPQIVRIVNDKSLIFGCPIDENLPKIFIKMKKFRRVEFIKKLEGENYFKNKYFLVKIVGWALNFKCPKGIIVNELGNSGNVEVETEVLLRTYEIDYSPEYPQSALEELKQYESKL
jgi:hypothetical protein